MGVGRSGMPRSEAGARREPTAQARPATGGKWNGERNQGGNQEQNQEQNRQAGRGAAPFAAPGAALLLALLLTATPARTEVPYPRCDRVPGCADPGDYASYLFLPPGELPADLAGGSRWKYEPGTGMDVVGAWERTTGRPDVVTAILDSGIRWGEAELVLKVALHTGELPLPPGCPPDFDCNRDGAVNVLDFAGAPCPRGAVSDASGNRNGILDAQDLIRLCSDGVDDDGNGFVDDIAGWDFQHDDNDPFDDTDYGHGTGEAEDAVAEAGNGTGFPGVAPSASFLPLKVADSFIAADSDFAQAVVYAVDRGVDVISEALGTVNAAGAATQAAIDYAYARGIPVVASAADEQSRHHNWPANYEHTLWVNSVRNGDGTVVRETDVYDILNGCTNYGGRAWLAVPSTSCSSEATGRTNGLVLLLVSHGRNLMDRGELAPYPGLDRPFSAEEIRQILRATARDVDHSGDPGLTTDPLLSTLLSSGALGVFFGSRRFPTLPGWDSYTGYGRPDARAMLEIDVDRIPPEADLSGSLRWFELVDPVRRPVVPVVGSARAVTRPGQLPRSFSWSVEVGCGVQPTSYTEIGAGASLTALERVELARLLPARVAADCGFDPAEPVGDERGEDPDAHTVTIRLRVVDNLGNLAEDRRVIAIHHDPDLRVGPIHLGASAEGSPALADLNRDGVLDIVLGTSDGAVHAIRGLDGHELPGFPAWTDPLPVHLSPGFARGRVPVPREGILAPAAAADLDGDGRMEVVVAGLEGSVYVFDDRGRRREGFPVRTDPRRSDPALVDRFNDLDPAITAAPTLVDLDPPGVHPALEIAVTAWDGHLYAWRADGTPVPGFPVRLADPARVRIDPDTGRHEPATAGVRARGSKILSSPAVGDLDGDGRPELVVATNEEYAGEPEGFTSPSVLFNLLLGQAGDLGDLSLDTAGRVYAVRASGHLDPRGPFLPGWPAPVPLLAPQLLPTVGTGTPGSPALADLDGDGTLTTAIFATVGPAMLLQPDGSPRRRDADGTPIPLAIDWPGFGWPGSVAPTAGSADGPFLPALGSGAFGDLSGDGVPEFVAPTLGVRKLVDVLAPGMQTGGDHQITAWDPLTHELHPAFPQPMDDMQFIGSPSLADVDGDGRPEVLAGSGAYLVRAYGVRPDGSAASPPGWPKHTNGWIIASPTPGDVDGDGRTEVVAATREGWLFVWDTPAAATPASIPWQGFARDRTNAGNHESPVPTVIGPPVPSGGLLHAVEHLDEALADHPARLAAAWARILLALVASAASDGDLARLAAYLPLADAALRHEALPPGLAGLFAGEVEAALRLLVQGASCSPGDGGCAEARAAAERELAIGRIARFLGAPELAFEHFASTLQHLAAL